MNLRMAVMGIVAALLGSAGCDDPVIMGVMPPGVPPPKVAPPTTGGAAEALGEGRSASAGGAPAVSKIISPPTPIGQPKTTPSGLVYETLREGTGPACKPGDTLKVDYVGRLDTGAKFDASADQGGAIPVEIGVGRGLAGWNEGIPGMKVGERRRLTLPPSIGYGPNGNPPLVPANATTIYDIDLLEITRTAPPPEPEKAPPSLLRPSKGAGGPPGNGAAPVPPR